MEKLLKTLTLFLISIPIFSQVYPLDDTLTYTIVDDVGPEVLVTKLINDTDDIVKYKFKINRINVPDDVVILYLDELSNYHNDISSCDFMNGTVTQKPGSCGFIGLYDLYFDEVRDMPWEFSYDVYRAPNCDSLLARLFFKIKSAVTPPSGIPPGSVWSYRAHSLTFGYNVWRVYPVRDTVINAQSYEIMAIDKGSGPLKESEIPVAIIDNKMYFVEDDTQKLMYDFSPNQKAGDTITYKIPKLAPLYDISSNGGATIPSKASYNQVVISDGSRIAYGHRFGYYDYKSIPNGEENHSMLRVFEGIGSEFGFFGAFSPWLTAGSEGRFLRYQSDFYNFDYDYLPGCVSTSTENIEEDKNVILYPNPAIDKITVTADKRINGIFLFDMKGLLIQSDNGNNEILLDNVKGGLYLVRIDFAKGKSTFKKLMVID